MLKLSKKIINVFILIIAIYILVDFNLKLPTGIIRRKYLIITPIRTDMSVVKKYLEKNNYHIMSISNFGYNSYSYEKEQGSYYIRVVIGEYRWIFVRSVTGVWIFDEDKKLIEIVVEKYIDAL